ncbi:MIP/aquaporin family protein [uncultured Hyphomicrobium sp.]|jgi:glycerol uptake facilitator-like aquaporin|uniref:aquaporin n=1 Tax=uncultured Hyphomicrobium sp. TaxID=194373 RepID=UPI0025E72951|nr:MIP/aquaporin family protein [uncultured Hyphomicrobium sp.]
MTAVSFSQRLAAEFVGSAILLATVIGSGIMGETLSGGNVAIALLGNTLATGAILVVLITMLGPISGAHFNPAVTAVFAARRDLTASDAVCYVLVQVAGAVLGVLIAHAMFDVSILQLSQKVRSGWAQAFSEWVAAFGLVATILLTLRARPDAIPTSVGLYITAAYWFTASTSFANPAVTLARAFSDTFAGIRMTDVPVFVVAQLVGAFCALSFVHLLMGARQAPEKSAAQFSPEQP